MVQAESGRPTAILIVGGKMYRGQRESRLIVHNGVETVYQICEKTGKRCYGQKDASNAIRCSKHSSNKKRIPLRSYYCEYCGTYHLTHWASFQRFGEKSTKSWYKKKKEYYKNHLDEDEV